VIGVPSISTLTRKVEVLTRVLLTLIFRVVENDGRERPLLFIINRESESYGQNL
jgi:hypothetical protein